MQREAEDLSAFRLRRLRHRLEPPWSRIQVHGKQRTDRALAGGEGGRAGDCGPGPQRNSLRNVGRDARHGCGPGAAGGRRAGHALGRARTPRLLLCPAGHRRHRRDHGRARLHRRSGRPRHLPSQRRLRLDRGRLSFHAAGRGPLRPGLRVLHQRGPQLCRGRWSSRELFDAGLAAGRGPGARRNQPGCLGDPPPRAGQPADGNQRSIDERARSAYYESAFS